ncbi:MAG: hypothetical protein ACLFUB_06160 [Cyclobacteriaceae bacterium]
MTNFIIISYFEDEQDQASFEQKIKDTFPRHTEEQTDEIRYIGFASKNQAGVEDNIKTMLNDYGIGTKEYVALYFSRPSDPDEIQRTMLLGHSDLIETDIQNIKPEDHVDTLSRLLNFDYVKEMRDR